MVEKERRARSKRPKMGNRWLDQPRLVLEPLPSLSPSSSSSSRVPSAFRPLHHLLRPQKACIVMVINSERAADPRDATLHAYKALLRPYTAVASNILSGPDVDDVFCNSHPVFFSKSR